MARPRVLVTGFGPFPGAPENPSAWLAETLGAQAPCPDADLRIEILPTEWRAVAALAPLLYASLQPDVMIHFGLCQRAAEFRIERAAFNRAQPRADASAALPPGRVIHADGAERLETTLPATRLVSHLKARGIPATSSPSAGRYLCNYLYYHSLVWAARQPHTPDVLFVHIPQLRAHGGPFTDAMLLRGASAILDFVVTHRRASSGIPAIPPMLADAGLLIEDEQW